MVSISHIYSNEHSIQIKHNCILRLCWWNQYYYFASIYAYVFLTCPSSIKYYQHFFILTIIFGTQSYIPIQSFFNYVILQIVIVTWWRWVWCSVLNYSSNLPLHIPFLHMLPHEQSSSWVHSVIAIELY